jgi:hypothetical protein
VLGGNHDRKGRSIWEDVGVNDRIRFEIFAKKGTGIM